MKPSNPQIRTVTSVLGTPMKLVNSEGAPVKVGDTVTSFRGKVAKVTGSFPPHSPASSGRIYVKFEDGGANGEYYPNVFDCKFVD